MKSYFDDCMTEEQLKARYRELCVKMHPDKNTDNPNATAEFQDMQQQYEERKAELAGDYTKARKGRERREREARENAERERKERERRKVEEVVTAARQNRQKHFSQLKPGDYIYARCVNTAGDSMHDDTMSTMETLRMFINHGAKDECVVKIETIVKLDDDDVLKIVLSSQIPDGIWGGWEVIQNADAAAGIKKAKRVAKVVMFCGDMYCVMGNPRGDRFISDYYMPINFEDMYSYVLGCLRAKLKQEKEEAARIEAERRAKLLARLQPLIEEWEPKLIELSASLTYKEKQAVAIDNLKTMLKGKFPGTTFKVKTAKYATAFHTLQWEDGPTVDEVRQVFALFDSGYHSNEITPWIERFGEVHITDTERKMNVLTKAKILQQLGQVSAAFRSRGIDDEVTLDNTDWMMLHLMVGIDTNSEDAKLCMSRMDAAGKRYVKVLSAISFIFRNTSYKKATKKTSKR